MIEFIADKNRKLSKLALYLVQDLSFSALQKLLRNKDVKVNGKRVSQDVMLNVGDKVILYYQPQQNAKFSTIYQDENIIVIDKKSGYQAEEIFNEILKIYKDAKFIHRLDRNTDGVMIFALNSIAEKELVFGFKNRTFDKKYKATVYGKMSKTSDLLTAYLLKDSQTSTVKIFDQKVKGSVLIKTGYEVLNTTENTSELLVTLHTGKTHQIRAHLAHIGHFIIGDGKYGDNKINKQFGEKTQKLHAYSITLFFQKESPLFYLNSKTFTTKR